MEVNWRDMEGEGCLGLCLAGIGCHVACVVGAALLTPTITHSANRRLCK